MKTYLALLALSACLATAATEEKINKSFGALPGGTLVLEVNFGSIEVVAGPGRTEATVDVWRKVTRWNASDEESYLKENPVEFIQDGNTLTIRARGKTNFSWSWFSSWRNRNEARYTIALPAESIVNLKTAGGSISVTGVNGSVKANTSGGSLKFTRVKGPLDGNTSGGSINLQDCEGELHIGTSGGGIHVTGGGGSLNAGTSGGGIAVKTFNGPIHIGTSGGSITVENIQGSIHGGTSGGSVHALLPDQIPGDVKLGTSGGSISVTTAATAAFTLDAETSGGGVHCDLPVTVQGNIGRSRVKGTVNNGGPLVHLRTSGGSINLRKN
ncbi:MAG: DUF4097 family beta strand repeat-containing protein [Nibricoccus sp.]